MSLKILVLLLMALSISIEGKAEVYPEMRLVEAHKQAPSLSLSFSEGSSIHQRILAGGDMPLLQDGPSVAQQTETAHANPVLTSWAVPMGATTDTTTLMPLRFDQQYGGGAGATGASSGQTTFGVFGLEVVPAMTISERYDSNVFMTPEIQGVRREDYATTVSPQLYVRDNGRSVSTLMQLGAIGEYFTVHPELSYIGFNGGLNLTFDNLIRRWIQGASLYFTNFANYTPVPPSFLTGGSSAYSPLTEQEGAATLSVEDTYTRGFQLQRVNTFSNQSTIGGLYPVSNRTNLVAAYSYGFINFGKRYQPTSTQNQSTSTQSLFDNVQQAARLGVSHRLTSQDIVLVQYTYNRDTFSRSGAGEYQAHGGSAVWTRSYSQALRSTVSGGATLVIQDFSGGTQSSWVYTANASLNWTRALDALSLSYSAGVFPGYVSSAGPVLSNMVAVTGTHRFRDNVVGGVGANYSSNKSVQGSSEQPAVSFESQSAHAWMNYRITQSTFLWLTYNYGVFSGNYSNANQTQTVHRQEAILSLSQYWR